MKTVLRMAWRNLLRHRARTALMVAIVAFGSLVVLLMWGITAGMFDSMTATYIELDYGSGGLSYSIQDGRIVRDERVK